MSPTVRIAHVVVPDEQSTRLPTEAEMRVIARFVDDFTRAEGVAPFADHQVPGVGRVLFSFPRAQ
jgi:hypothetical protein